MKHVTMSLGVLVLGTVAFVALSPTARAESRTPAEATQHALDELANTCAQRSPECPTATPTLTPPPTWTPSPTLASSPVPPTDTPTPTPTPEPCWVTDQDLGDPDNGYIVVGADGAPIPCPSPELLSEVAGVQATEPAATVTPTATPTVPPAPPAAAPAPQIQVLVQTVVVVITATPIDTPTPRPTVVEPSATPTVVPSRTPRPTATVAPAAAAVLATPIPTAIPTPPAATAVDRAPAPAVDRTGLYASVLMCIALAALAAVWLVRRGRRQYAP